MKTNGELVPGVDCAIVDNVANDRREVWRSGVLAVALARELVEHERGIVDKMVAAGRIPKACSATWSGGRIQGDKQHVPLPYRPIEPATGKPEAGRGE